MNDIVPFGIAVFFVAVAIVMAVLSNRLSSRIYIPAPALFLIAAVALAAVFPVLGTMPQTIAERIVSMALVFILFDGGRHIGLARFRTAAGAVAWIGIAGTAVTAVAIAAAAHFLFGFNWLPSLLIGAALAPTDPAVVFSILGKREISGRTGTILEGESGANDPVGIAIMVSLLAATGTGFTAVAEGLAEFAIQMVVGAAVGVAGGLALSFLLKKVFLGNEALHSILAIACAAFIFGAGTALHGSGFLAVFVAGILIGDLRAPYKHEIERFSAGIASLSEIIAFAILGLSIRLSDVIEPRVQLIGLGIAGLLIFVIRPVLVGLLIVPIRLRVGERAFILWAGLKGAVPILLGMFVLSSGIDHAREIYAIIFVVVLVSVVLQGALVPLFARLFHIPMRIVEPDPWVGQESPSERLQAEHDGSP